MAETFDHNGPVKSIHDSVFAGAVSLRALGFHVLLLVLVSGCSSRTLPVTEVRPADEGLPLMALEAFRDESRFFVRYQQGSNHYYSGGNWRKHVGRVPAAHLPDDHLPIMVSLEYRQPQPWQILPSKPVQLPILGADRWRYLRERLLQESVPAGQGLAVDFGPVEFFLYRDDAGRFEAVPFDDRPADVPLHESLSLGEFLRRGQPLLDELLRAEDIKQNEFVFNTGDAGLYSLPFLYVNRARGLAIFVRNYSGHTPPKGVPGLQTAQAVGHVVRSHLSNLVLRPVSSLYRLFFVVTDSAVSTVSFDWATGLADKPVVPVATAAPMDLDAWEQELEQIATRPVSRGEVDLLVDGDAFFPRFTEVLEEAESSVRLQAYIFDNDDFALQIGELLKRRSRKGIDVRILLDGLGTIAGTMADPATLPEYHRAPESVHLYLQEDSKIAVRQKPNPWFTGDHVKSTVVDDRVAFVGGMNIGREYRYDWHDTMLEVRGPIVDEIADEFDAAWAHAGLLGDLGYLVAQTGKRRATSDAQGIPLRLLLTEPGNYEIFRAQRAAIRRAQSYIYIQNAYFTDDQLLRELVLARRRGVDVRVVMPLETDHGPIDRSNVLAANLMLSHGIRVYIFPGFSHVKAAIYDGWVCIGSANFDRWSLKLNREMNIASSHPELATQVRERLFEPDFAASPELSEPVPERWTDYLIEILGDYVY